MNGKGAYAVPVDMPLVAKKPLKRTMSKKAKEYFDFMNSRNIELFEDENTGELFSKVTDLNTGKTEIRKCTFTDEDQSKYGNYFEDLDAELHVSFKTDEKGCRPMYMALDIE